VTAHQAGNAGYIGLTIADGGGHAGFFVNNSHDGTYSDQHLTFKTGEGGVSASTERMRITPNGNVGIGTTSPTQKLDVRGAIAMTDGGTQTTYISNAGEIELARTDGDAYIDFKTSTAEDYDCRISQISDGLRFSTGGSGASSERMRINSSGNVGIGTTSPTGKLTVSSDIDVLGSNFANVEFTGASVNGSGVYTGLDSGGGYVINVRDSGYIGFSTTNAERMRIDASGNVLVNKTNTTEHTDGLLLRGNATSVIARDNDALAIWADNATANTGGTKGHILFKRGTNAVLVGSVTSTTSATSFNTSSDYRLKENVNYTFDATTRLKQLKPARFNFKVNADSEIVDGFLAHEVSSIVPEAITGAKDAVDGDGNPVYQSIDQSKLVPLLVKTIQELEARITALEAG